MLPKLTTHEAREQVQRKLGGTAVVTVTSTNQLLAKLDPLTEGEPMLATFYLGYPVFAMSDFDAGQLRARLANQQP